MRARLIALVCLTVGTSTVPIGAFPALLPDLDRVGLSDVQLGALAAGFGFARMVMDVPVGLFVARHLTLALAASPILLTLGIATIASGGPFPVLLGGRLLMGFAHALGMVAWLTTILRYQSGATLGRALNAMEFTAMIGMLAGTAAIGLLPRAWSWNVVLAVACVPQLLGIVLGLLVARAVPRAEATPSVTPAPAPRSSVRARHGVALAFATGTVMAVAYAMLEGYLIPLRGSREFDLDRTGVARLLIVAQLVDMAALLPVGVLADRAGVSRLLAVILAAAAVATVLVSFGGYSSVVIGAACLGLAMAGWMLPVTLLRQGTPPARIAWRTALYRVGVDGGLFLGPFLAGVLGARTWLLSTALVIALGLLAVLVLTTRAETT
jgi:MFS family permease